MSAEIQLSPFQALMLVGMFGVYGTLIPSPYDIGELLVHSVYDATTCPSEWCQEMKDRVLSYYYLGTMIMMVGGGVRHGVLCQKTKWLVIHCCGSERLN